MLGPGPAGSPGPHPAAPPADRAEQGGQGGGFGGQGGFGGRATGRVTAVSGSTITVSGVSFGSDDPVTYTVLVNGDTTYTRSVDATADALAVGRCAVVNGESDDTGAVTATRIALSEATNGVCALGFAGGGRAGSAGSGSANG
ncbi:DUF5666 domain-containing protein [Frankia sp. Cpl3]|uniref:DUF5666 domain-containing protein n=1 Tax=Parafrankia colletiae TaxID=573497 RepID=UPI001F5180E6|nr:DUF5666 domain-containing protein [Parafrankia colletiae]MCK9902964.1 DUF5666 domain-containing protein [Frankia sp. Cpl3]